jgi:hypothetical protein
MDANDLERFKGLIERLRATVLFDEDLSGLGPMSEQYVLLSLASLEQAERFMKIAHYHLMRKD